MAGGAEQYVFFFLCCASAQLRIAADTFVGTFVGSRGELLFVSNAPASPGDGNLSFIGVVFADARVAQVRIIAGDTAPGPNDDRRDIVVMDDFLYGEPTAAY